MAVSDKRIEEIAKQINTIKIKDKNQQEIDCNIILIYAFNGTGKTRLSMKYKDITKVDENHTGVYYNAYSEDLFQWDNDAENEGKEIVLNIVPSSLNKYHSFLLPQDIEKYLKRYNFTFKIELIKHDDEEKGIKAVRFYNEDNDKESIKISRGEERIFIWCFFLALFDIGGLSDNQNKHFYIDDPVSSLDENNIFITSTTIKDLINGYSKTRKIIISTHHIGLFYILANWLKTYYNNKYSMHRLVERNGQLLFEEFNKDVFLYHLVLISILDELCKNGEFQGRHIVWVRQLLEYISSFLGYKHFSAVLDKIKYDNADMVADMTNTLSHKNIFSLYDEDISPDMVKIYTELLQKIKEKYEFKI